MTDVTLHLCFGLGKPECSGTSGQLCGSLEGDVKNKAEDGGLAGGVSEGSLSLKDSTRALCVMF